MIKELIVYFIFEKLKFKKFVRWRCEVCGCSKHHHEIVNSSELHCDVCGWCL